ncbi:MAG: hypothetical protein L0229_05055 [Blastocatellia bacterium]|nr:hypothetical protein [Blastocatellia bacterium]
MKTNALRGRIGGAALMVALALGITIAASGTAQAQYRDYRNDQYGRYDRGTWPKDRTRDYAYKLSYMKAYTEAQSSAQRGGYRIDYDKMPGYRDDDNGYLVWMGDRGAYRDYYRKGYKDGFRDAQAGRARRHRRDDVERVLGARLRDVYGNDRYDRYDDDHYERDRNRGRYDDRNDRNDRNGRYDRNEIIRIAQQNGYRDGLRHGQEDRNRRRNYDHDHSSDYRNATRGYASEYRDRSLYQQAYREGYKRGYDDGYRNNGRGRRPF